jgi:hypothetical protein
MGHYKGTCTRTGAHARLLNTKILKNIFARRALAIEGRSLDKRVAAQNSDKEFAKESKRE